MLDEKLQQETIARNRDFMRGYREGVFEEFESDQERKLPQPPLVKAAMAKESDRVPLSLDFSALPMRGDLEGILRDRRSARVYTQQSMALLQLSFLLWATQGVKSIRGKAYATMRTVPSGGARHAFETYLLADNVEGLRPGAYHYLPMEHAVEYLHPVDDFASAASDALCGQTWAGKANVIFFWAMNAYRAEWRYGVFAHRVALLDAGHVAQNLYLACTGLRLGVCGIAAFDDVRCNRLFGLDGQDEFVVYTAPVGTVRDCDLAAENAFYQFVKDEGL